MRPLLSRVILKVIPPAQKVGIIHIPEKYQRDTQEGTVVAIGSEVQTLKVGDQVIFGKWNTTRFPGLDHHVVIWERDIMVVLE